jgi:hypothetical protein
MLAVFPYYGCDVDVTDYLEYNDDLDMYVAPCGYAYIGGV